MKPYKKKITVKVETNNNLKHKLKQYFKFYGFDFSENDQNSFVFFKKFSFLDGWKYNPLNWESKVDIKLSKNTLEINYINEGNSHITPYAFNDLFISFFNNLESYLNTSTDFKEKNKTEIKKAKKKILFQFLIIIISVICFALIGRLILEKFRIQFFDIFGVIIVGLISLKLINQFWINKLA